MIGAILRISTIKFKNPVKEWYRHTDFLTSAIDIIESKLDVVSFNYVMIARDDEFIPINSIRSFSIEQQVWHLGLFEFFQQPVLHSGTTLIINIYKDSFDLIIDIEAKTDVLRLKLLNQYKEVCMSLYKYFKPVALIGYDFTVESYGVEFTRSKPLRWNTYWGVVQLINMASMEYHDKSEVGKPLDVKKLMTLQLPPGTNREIIDDLIIISWVSDLTNEETVASMLHKRDEWFAKYFDLPIDTDTRN